MRMLPRVMSQKVIIYSVRPPRRPMPHVITGNPREPHQLISCATCIYNTGVSPIISSDWLHVPHIEVFSIIISPHRLHVPQLSGISPRLIALTSRTSLTSRYFPSSHRTDYACPIYMYGGISPNLTWLFAFFVTCVRSCLPKSCYAGPFSAELRRDRVGVHGR